ncbi:small GTPase superfamily [Immersiella caudata]|uniref:Small GTPase superfamily n=1 Tax=Immersiella caudata TaxID=314043 RepID=A0AA40BZT6_9PEZI|nr:small GTPase superfamily [Immersiella caudata]
MVGGLVLYKLVVLGDGGVGKTALTIQTYDPTVEDSYRKQAVIDDQACMLEILDSAGQEEYTALRDQWIRDGEGFVVVYSVSSRSSFSRIKRFRHQIRRIKEASAADLLARPEMTPTPPVPIMLVGNKSDGYQDREVSTQEGEALARELRCEFVETSAKNFINVNKGILRRCSDPSAAKTVPTKVNGANRG